MIEHSLHKRVLSLQHSYEAAFPSDCFKRKRCKRRPTSSPSVLPRSVQVRGDKRLETTAQKAAVRPENNQLIHVLHI